MLTTKDTKVFNNEMNSELLLFVSSW